MKNTVAFTISLALLLFASIAAAAQEKFDIVSYKAPAGWQKTSAADSVRFSKQDARTVGIMLLFKSNPTDKSSKEVFDVSWDTIVKGLLTKVDPPKMNQPLKQNGWTIESGAAAGESDGGKIVALLLSATGGGKFVNLLVLYNSETLQSDIDAFIGSIDLGTAPKTVAKAAQPLVSGGSRQASTLQELDGLYPSCSMSGYALGSTARTIVSGRTKRFIIRNGTYSVYNGIGGKVRYENGVVTFIGGEFNGWKAVSEILAGGDYSLYFRADRSKVTSLDTGRFVGDEQCKRTTGEL